MPSKHRRNMVTLCDDAYDRLNVLAVHHGLTVPLLLRAVSERIAATIEVPPAFGRLGRRIGRRGPPLSSLLFGLFDITLSSGVEAADAELTKTLACYQVGQARRDPATFGASATFQPVHLRTKNGRRRPI